MNFIAGVVLVLLAAPPQGAPAEVPQDLLAKWKNATVFIVASGAEGSGFLVRVDGRKGYVVTNNHVVADTDRVTVWFHSGEDRAEQKAAGAVLRNDPDNDVAIVGVELAELPGPFDLQKSVEAQDTTPVVILGFPYGSLLKGAKARPSVTVSQGTITGSTRLKNRGHVGITIVGDAHPGNSGGPVVDQAGSLVGILSAKVPGTRLCYLVPISCAQSLWLDCEEELTGLAPRKKPPAVPLEKAVGRIEITGAAVADERVAVGSAWATTLQLDSANIAGLLWSEDGRFVYILERAPGVLHKISVSDWKEERRLRIGSECGDIAFSQEGIVVLVTGARQVWTVGPNTLGIKMRATIEDLEGVAASPRRSQGFVSRGATLAIVDLPTGIVTREIRASTMTSEQGFKIRRHRSAGPLNAWSHPALTPDGASLFCVSSNGLHRFKVEEHGLTYEEAGDPLADDDVRFVISPDSRYIAPLRSRAAAATTDPSKVRRETRIFRVGDLQSPALRLPLMSRTLGFDPLQGGFFAEDGASPLIGYSAEGKIGASFAVAATEPEGPARILVHPDGRSALVLTPSVLRWVELPR